MSIGISRDEGVFRIELDGTIDISYAADLKSSLLEALEMGQEIRVGFVGAAELDVTAVQLLWAAGQDARKRGVEFRVAEPPESVRRSLEEMGVDLNAIYPCVAGTAESNIPTGTRNDVAQQARELSSTSIPV